jgi:hypothetical protein
VSESISLPDDCDVEVTLFGKDIPERYKIKARDMISAEHTGIHFRIRRDQQVRNLEVIHVGSYSIKYIK